MNCTAGNGHRGRPQHPFFPFSGSTTDTISRTTKVPPAEKSQGLPRCRHCPSGLPPVPPSAASRLLRSVPGGERGRRDRTVAAAASRTGPVGAARAYASQGNDARQAATASDPTDAASSGAGLAGRQLAPHASRPATCRAGKGKVWLPPLGLNFPALRCKSPPFPRRQSPRAPAFRAPQ